MPIIATAATAPNNAASTTTLSSEIEKDAIHSRITSENKIRICVQKRKMVISFSTDLALSSSYALPLIHALSSTETMPSFHTAAFDQIIIPTKNGVFHFYT